MDKTIKQKLEHLNFSGVLNYKRPIVRRPRDGSPLNTCVGFCHDCENRGLSPNEGSSGILMSHGCTSDDFAEIIGQPFPEIKHSEPIMFLLENPGGDYDLGDVRSCDNVAKKPPTKQFYFSSDLRRWPTSIADIQNRYGDYFAYLMFRFGLSNVYITNCVKCKYPDTSDPKLENPLKCYADTADNCIARFLEKEIAIFRPRIIFCFGKKVSDELLWKRIQQPGKLSGVQFDKVVLVHPAASDRHPPKYPSFAEVVQENDRRINKVLATMSTEATT